MLSLSNFKRFSEVCLYPYFIHSYQVHLSSIYHLPNLPSAIYHHLSIIHLSIFIEGAIIPLEPTSLTVGSLINKVVKGEIHEQCNMYSLGVYLSIFL